MKQNPPDDDFDPIGALLDEADDEGGPGEPAPPAPLSLGAPPPLVVPTSSSGSRPAMPAPEPISLGAPPPLVVPTSGSGTRPVMPPAAEPEDLVADLVASVDEPLEALMARGAPAPTPVPLSAAPSPTPGSGSSPVSPSPSPSPVSPSPGPPQPGPPAAPAKAPRRAAGPPRIAAVSPAAAPGFDVSKLLRLTLAGCAVGLVWFAAVTFWPTDLDLGPDYRSPLDRDLSRAEQELAGFDAAATAKELSAGLVTKDPELMPEILEAAALPARDVWMALAARPEKLAAAPPEDRARFEKLAARLAAANQALLGAGLAPAYPQASAPLACLGDVGGRLGRAPEELAPPPAWEPPPLRLEGAERYLLVIRDMAHTISRRQAGAAAQALLDLGPALGWTTGLAPPATILGTPAPPEGDVSPAALATALLEVSQARTAAARGRVEVPLLHRAARRVLAGFPVTPDDFGAAWTRVACELYAITGHDALVAQAARAFAERANALPGGPDLARQVVAGLLTLLGDQAPADLVALWSELSGGTPPDPPGRWWKDRPPLRRAVNGLAGIVPDRDRLEGAGQGGPSTREREQRYQRFQRRRGKLPKS